MAADSPALLEARNVCKYYRAGTAREVRALDGVSLAVARGSLVVLTGRSGSGKSTLLAVLGALERPSRGQVFFQGCDLSRCSDVELSRVRRRMGFVFQDFALVPGLAVWENVTYPLVPRGVSRSARHARAEALLARLGLKDRLRDRPEELSGGEQQRVALARALAGQPEVILADEPTSNLDAEAAAAVMAALREFHAAGGTVILASHDPHDLAAADVRHVLEQGRLRVPAP